MEWEVVAWVILLFLVIIGLGFMVTRRSSNSIRANFESLSHDYGLEITLPEAKGFGLFQASPSVFGEWEGRKMSVQTMTAGLKDSRQAETAVHLETALREDCRLVIRSKRGLNRLERSEFKKLIRVKGPSEDFDKRISIMTNRPEWVSERITAKMCERILAELGSTHGTVLLVKSTLTYRELGLLTGRGTVERIEMMIALLKWLADTLEDGEGA
ncbi:MAG: hypothetical protein AAGJ81_00615 [Verrucomicrobiota bacterium]